ncbi:plasma membrane proteolipid 3 [Monosporozyma unispora]|nr:plasma membrane proteolipid Pmp3 [Kazachstania unispora]
MSTASTLINAVIAILLPPLAVFIADGLGGTFFIDLVLTIFAWIPGVLFALYIVFARRGSTQV